MERTCVLVPHLKRIPFCSRKSLRVKVLHAHLMKNRRPENAAEAFGMQRGRIPSPAFAGERVLPLFSFHGENMNATELAQATNSDVQESMTVADLTLEAWTQLARRYYPNLAFPIARALAQRALQGPYGAALHSIAHGLEELDANALREMTGSELQMLSCLLMELGAQTQRLLAQVNAEWRPD